MRKQNFKSDFDFVLAMLDSQGNDVGFPEINWELTLSSASKQFAYVASHQYGENTNCYNDECKIHIVVDGHEFPVGELTYELSVEIPDKNFPDGSRRVFVKGSTGIEIVNEVGQQLTDATVDAQVPHLLKAQDPEQNV